MHDSKDRLARLQSEVAALKSELAVSERLRIAMYSSIAQKGGAFHCCKLVVRVHSCVDFTVIGAKKGYEGQTPAVSMLLLG